MDQVAQGRGQMPYGRRGVRSRGRRGEGLHGQGEEGVAGEYGRAGAVRLPERGTAAAQRVAVHDVVVQQREGVHEFHRDSTRHARRTGTSGRLRAQDGQRLPYALALAVGRGGAADLAAAQRVSDHLRHPGVQSVDRLREGRCDQFTAAAQDLWRGGR